MMQRRTNSTRAEDDGVLTYVFLQQQNSPREYVLYEQWHDSAALNAHLKRLQKLFGPPREGGAIPAATLDLLKRAGLCGTSWSDKTVLPMSPEYTQ
jgi:hypothetical protein